MKSRESQEIEASGKTHTFIEAIKIAGFKKLLFLGVMLRFSNSLALTQYFIMRRLSLKWRASSPEQQMRWTVAVGAVNV